MKWQVIGPEGVVATCDSPPCSLELAIPPIILFAFIQDSCHCKMACQTTWEWIWNEYRMQKWMQCRNEIRNGKTIQWCAMTNWHICAYNTLLIVCLVKYTVNPKLKSVCAVKIWLGNSGCRNESHMCLKWKETLCWWVSREQEEEVENQSVSIK